MGLSFEDYNGLYGKISIVPINIVIIQKNIAYGYL